MAKSPLQTVKDRFKDKAALVSAVQALMTDELWVDRLNDDKGLDSVSNKKLLHLHDVLSEVKKAHGTRAKLIDAVAKAQNRVKDADFKTSLEGLSTPRLLDLLKAATKRAS
jgi:hypothetical protein